MTVFYPVSKTLEWIGNPSAWALVLVAGAVLASRRPGWSAALAGLAAAQLLAFSTPRVVDGLQRWLQSSAPTTYRPDRRYDAAIVLGGGYDRVDLAARIVREGRGRYLVYTGRLTRSDAARMVRDLERRGVDARRVVIGDRARNTNENAIEAAAVVAEHGWSSLLIVTDAIHMPRALACFRARGLAPDTLPVDVGGPPRVRGWVPDPRVLDESRAVLHEIVGRIVYRVAGYAA